MKSRLFAVVLAAALLAGCAAPGMPGGSGPAVQGPPAPAASVADVAYDRAAADAAAMDFAVRLLQNAAAAPNAPGASICGLPTADSISNDAAVANALVAPYSVYSALGMAAAGAEGATLAEMTAALGLAPNALGAYLRDYAATLPDDGCLHGANGLWLREDPGLAVEDSFLQFNTAHYGAAVRRAAFDAATVADINAFVRQNTAGRISGILDRLEENTMLVLVNALSFDAEWETVYREEQVGPDTFTAQDGSAQSADFLYSTEEVFLRDGAAATGFLKYYAGRRYALAVLLPAAGTTVQDYLAGLDGARLAAVLQNAETEATVLAAMPCFTLECGYSLAEALCRMGMPSAFDADAADFSALGHYDGTPLFIGDVLHKTFLRVDARGTQAGAATAVMMDAGGAMPEREVYKVHCDRPFVFMLLDAEASMPLFFGTVGRVA